MSVTESAKMCRPGWLQALPAVQNYRGNKEALLAYLGGWGGRERGEPAVQYLDRTEELSPPQGSCREEP